MNLPLSTSSWKYQPDSKNHIHIAERHYIKTLIFNSFNSVNSFNLSNNCHKELHLRWWSGSWISPWLQWYFASHFSFGKNLIQFDSHLCGKQPSKEIGKSYFNTVGSRPQLPFKFLQQKFTVFSCQLLSQRAPS